VHFLRRPGWWIRESEVTEEDAFHSRRAFLKELGLSGIALAAGSLAGGSLISLPGKSLAKESTRLRETIERTRHWPLAASFPAPTGRSYPAGRPLSDELVAAEYNNYYEFTTVKQKVWELAQRFQPWPWQLEVTGHAEKTGRFDLEEVFKSLNLEERIYRFRCVEAWTMTVPWTGVPLAKLLQFFRPTSKAKYVRFVSFKRPSQAEGQRNSSGYSWPYYEALGMDEAMNEMALAAVGVYGHPLPVQHGAPLRIVVPWKYGFKNPKAITRIEFVSKRPHTFWNDLVPKEYGFTSNVNPHRSHPRWSQAEERLIGSGTVVPTRIFNGYGEWVGTLYPKERRS